MIVCFTPCFQKAFLPPLKRTRCTPFFQRSISNENKNLKINKNFKNFRMTKYSDTEVLYVNLSDEAEALRLRTEANDARIETLQGGGWKYSDWKCSDNF